MHTKICGTSRAPLLTLLLFLVSLGFAVYLNARPPAQDASKPVAEQEKVQTAASAAASGDYVGSATCKTCHEDMPSKGFYKNFEDSPHFVTTLDTRKGPEWHGCEACHGPGKAHMEGGGNLFPLCPRNTRNFARLAHLPLFAVKCVARFVNS
ncbi:MAG: hypothetical protein DMG40_18850 [Acidobacteria bacterium]|nr:MAG: hypothetical protein DMG40_18850 [Acidobacteriota bacterium]